MIFLFKLVNPVDYKDMFSLTNIKGKRLILFVNYDELILLKSGRL